MENFKLNLPYSVKMVENPVETIGFSIVMITKNEESYLQSILNSLTEFKEKGGEVNILDLGSTDETIDIAIKWGCKIETNHSFSRIIDDEMAKLINEKFKRDNDNIVNSGDTYIDYSAARDYAATLSSNDMILMIDPKSIILSFNLEEIKNQIKNGYTRLIGTVEDKKYINEFYDRRKYKWNNIYNEFISIFDSIENVFFIPYNDFRIQHLNVGPITFESNTKEKVTGLSVNCFMGGDYELNKSFGELLFNCNFFNSALQQYFTCLSMTTSNPEKSKNLLDIGTCFMRIDRINEAIEYYNKAFTEYNWRTPLYKLGEYYFQKSMWQKCIFYLEGCLNIPRTTELTEDEFIFRDGPYSMLYVAFWWIGDIKKGKLYFDKALEFDPYNATYLAETIYHYKYSSSNINGYLSFQNTQFLYEKSKKYKTILEIYPEDGRATHALVNGSNDLVTVIRKNPDNIEYLNSIENPGNLRLLNMTTKEAIELFEQTGEKFDMIFINKNYDEIINDYNPHWGLLIWEKFANYFICGSDYEGFKKIIDGAFEISGTENNIWYKNISQFEKTIVYKRKNI